MCLRKQLKSVVKTSYNEIKQLTQQFHDEKEMVQKLTQELQHVRDELICLAIGSNPPTMIDLNNKAIGDCTLQVIAHSKKLTNFTELHLSGSNITDVDIKALTSSTTLSNLTSLDLRNNSRITYAGIETLLKSTALPRLSQLSLTLGPITEFQVRDLKKIRPFLRIEFYY